MPSRNRILGATGIAAVLAAIILVVAVLPAEYGIDPLRTGSALGLTALARGGSNEQGGTEPSRTLDAVRPGVNTPQLAPYRQDHFEVDLRPFEGVEYKYRVEKGGSFVYAWTATERVGYEFHGEPDGAPRKYFESYDKAQGTRAQGVFIAPASGIHGWFWENLGPNRVKVTLTTSGFYGSATEFRDGEKIVHEPQVR